MDFGSDLRRPRRPVGPSKPSAVSNRASEPRPTHVRHQEYHFRAPDDPAKFAT